MTPAKKGKVTEIYEPSEGKSEPEDKTRLREEIETGEGLALQSGQTIGRYQIVEQLGAGGMANVYKALDTRLERFVALKVIHTAYSRSQQFLQRFEREAKSVAALAHPNIVGVIDYGHHEGLPYMVMEYIPGGTLKEHLGEPIPYRQAVCLLAPVARALEAAHQEKIVHRDVKPSNILITRSGQPMLSDFGVAKILEVQAGKGLTEVGMGLGTPEYMSPEQGLGEKVDHRADVYALGVVLYEMVTGRLPYTADTPVAILVKQASQPLPNPRAIVKDLPDSVLILILKSLAKEPGQRYQSMGEFAMALEEVCRGQAVVVPAAPVKAKPKKLPRQRPVQQVKEKPSRGHMWLWLIPILLIPFLAVAGWWLITRPPIPTSEPTLTPMAPAVPETTGRCVAMPAINDSIGTIFFEDFNNDLFEGRFDPNIWAWSEMNSSLPPAFLTWSNEGGGFATQNGRMTGTQSQKPQTAALLVHQPTEGMVISQPVFIEADIQMDSEMNGSFSAEASDAVAVVILGNSPNGETWLAYCQLQRVGNGQVQGVCGQFWVGSTTGQDFSLPLGSTPIDTAQHFRIEFDPQAALVSFYHNENLMGTSSVENGENLGGLCYRFGVGMNTFTDNAIKGYFDNIHLGVLPEEDQVDQNRILVQDDFENTAYEGSVNFNLWRVERNFSRQENGILIVPNNTKMTGNSVHARQLEQIQMTHPFYFEADLAYDPENTGFIDQTRNAVVMIWVNGYTLDPSHWWSATCELNTNDGISQAGGCSQTWNESTQWKETENFSAPGFSDQIGTWHHVRIEVDPINMQITFYFDGYLIGSTTVANTIGLEDHIFSFSVGVYNNDELLAIGWFDNVEIGYLP